MSNLVPSKKPIDFALLEELERIENEKRVKFNQEDIDRKRDWEWEKKIEEILYELGEKVLARDKTIRAEGLR